MGVEPSDSRRIRTFILDFVDRSPVQLNDRTFCGNGGCRPHSPDFNRPKSLANSPLCHH